MKSPVSGKSETIKKINEEFLFDSDGKSEDKKEPSKVKKFNFNQKSVLLTYPQSKLTKEGIFKGLSSKFNTLSMVVVAQEHHKDGNVHYHAWLEWPKKFNSRDPRVFDIEGEHPNIGQMINQKKNSRTNALKYLFKEDKDPQAYGIDIQKYMDEEAKKKKRSYIGAKLINGEKTVEEIVKEFPEELYNYDKLKSNLGAFKLNTLGEQPPLIEALWIWGPTGCGKTCYVHQNYGDSLYNKASNKWWDGYQGQKTVLIDDLDTPALGHYLKIWGDKYPKSGEIKGGHIPLPYQRIIITSNYTPEELFKDDKIMIGPIYRRFRVVTTTGNYPDFKLVPAHVPQEYAPLQPPEVFSF